MTTNKSPREYSVFHLVLIIFFIIGFIIRIIGAINISTTEEEATVLLSTLDQVGSALYPPPFLLQLLILGMNSIFGENLIWVRLPFTIIGSLIILLPALFKKRIGEKTALWIAAFFVIDPFLVANSVTINGNILAIFFSSLLFFFFQKDRPLLKLLLIIAIFASGYGCGYLLITVLIYLIFKLISKRDSVMNAISFWRSGIRKKILASKENWLIILVFGITLFLQPVEFSSILSGISQFASQWISSFSIMNSPFLYFMGLISYYPLALIPLFLLSFSNTKKSIRANLNLSGIIAISLIIIAVYPGHHFSDLVWVSILLCIFLAQFLSQRKYSLKKEELFFILLFAIGFTSLFISILDLSNRIFIGSFRLENLLESVFLGILIGLGVLIISLFFPNIKLAKALRISIFLFLLSFQMIILNRVIGINNKPDQELIWAGYPTDLELTKQIIDEYASSYKDSQKHFGVQIEDGVHPSLVWELYQGGYFLNSAVALPKNKGVYISRSEVLSDSVSELLTQRFVVNAYPVWVRQPLKSITHTNFWKWLLWRDSDVYKEYNFLNIRAELQKE